MATAYYSIDSSKIDSTLTNFPVGVKITESAFFSGLGADDWENIHATVGGTECYVEVDQWDPANDLAVLWVKVPSVSSSTDTVIKIETGTDNTATYVGETGDTAAQNVWDDDFVAVYHMSQDPSGGTDAIKDSTSNGNDGTSAGSMTSGDLVDGGFGKALEFDGSDDRITSTDDIGITGTTNRTTEVFFKTSDNSNTFDLLSFGSLATDRHWGHEIIGSSRMRLAMWGSSRVWDCVYSDGNFHYSAVALNGNTASDLVGYFDGSAATVDSTSAGTFNTAASSIKIGARISDNSLSMDGAIGEVRVSDIVRSAAWIKATYNVLNDSLLTYSATDPGVYSAKSVVFDFANDYGASYLGCRAFDFYLNDELVELTESDFTAYAGSSYNSYVLPKYVFITGQTETGSASQEAWHTASGQTTNQRLIVVFDTAIEFDTIKFNNYHNSGSDTTRGVKDTKIHISTDSISDTTYMASVPNSEKIFDGTLPEHAATDTLQDYELTLGITADETEPDIAAQGIGFSEAADATKYSGVYSAKSVVFDIADNYGSSYLGCRGFDFYVNDELISVADEDFTGYAGSTYSGTVAPKYAFITGQDETGNATNEAWHTASGQTTNQRLIVVFDEAILFDSIKFNNYHHIGGNTDRGIKNTEIYVSTDSITDTVYGNSISNSTKIFDGTLPEHAATDTRQDYELTLIGGATEPDIGSEGIGFSETADGEKLLYTWNPDDKNASISLSNGNRTATSISQAWKSARSFYGKSSGKRYFELDFSNVVIGDNVTAGFGNSSAGLASYVGADANGWGYAGSNGRIYNSGSGSVFGSGFSENDVVGIAIDLDNGKAWFSVNGTWQDSGDPANGTDEALSGLSGTLFPMASLYGNTDAVIIALEADQQEYSPPAGFTAWDGSEPATSETEPDIASQGLGLGESADGHLQTLNRGVSSDLGVGEAVGVNIEKSRGVSSGLGLADVAVGEHIPAEAPSEPDVSSQDLGLADTIGREITAERAADEGLGLSETVGVGREISRGNASQIGFNEVVGVTREQTRGIAGAIGFESVAHGLNFTRWARENLSRCVRRYYVRITGAADGLADYDISSFFKSFSFRMRSGSPSYLGVVLVYDTTALAAINARSNGEIVVDMAAVLNGVETLREELARANFDSVRYDRGGSSQSISLTGYKTVTYSAKNSFLSQVVSETLQADGRYRYRCANPDFYLKPGDTASYNENSFTVGTVTCSISPTSQFMDVQEAAA